MAREEEGLDQETKIKIDTESMFVNMKYRPVGFIRSDVGSKKVTQRILNQYSYKKIHSLAKDPQNDKLGYKLLAEAFRKRIGFTEQQYKEQEGIQQQSKDKSNMYDNLVVNTVLVTELDASGNELSKKEVLVDQDLFRVDWIVYEAIDTDE